jgi:hypothetical protein
MFASSRARGCWVVPRGVAKEFVARGLTSVRRVLPEVWKITAAGERMSLPRCRS